MKYRYLIIFISLLACHKSLACSCSETTPEDYIANCEELYIATLEEVRLKKRDGLFVTTEGVISKPKYIIKGKMNSKTKITNKRMGSSCDSFLQAGEDYIVCKNGKVVENMMCGFTHSLYWNDSEKFYEKFNK